MAAQAELVKDYPLHTPRSLDHQIWLYQRQTHVWLDQKNSKKHNHSTDQNKSTNHGSNALPIQLGSQSGSILAIVQNYKSITSRKINKLLKTPGSTIWHRNYYEDHPG